MGAIQLKKGFTTLIDDEDIAMLKERAIGIYLSGTRSDRRVIARVNKKNVSFPRFIMNAPIGMMVDHINRDPLDNRRCNLRICTPTGNARNRSKGIKRQYQSKYKGTIKHNHHWWAQIETDGTKHKLGRYATEIEAARAYDIAALSLHGEFACINHIDLSVTPKRLDRPLRTWRPRKGRLFEQLPDLEDSFDSFDEVACANNFRW